MTREEHIENLFSIMDSMPDDTCGDWRDSIAFAISALQQEPCEDAISRQAAIDACLNGWNKDYKEIVEEIRALPPVKPQYTDTEIQKMQDLEFAEIQKAYEIGKAENPNRWIPVSERLPELTINDSVAGKQYTEDVLVYDGADLRVGYFVRNDKLDFSYWVAYGEDDYKPIAWMPIESYKASPTGAEKEG